MVRKPIELKDSAFKNELGSAPLDNLFMTLQILGVLSYSLLLHSVFISSWESEPAGALEGS
jgi:hypothetical protein